MVSTQNSFFPSHGFPPILGASPVTKNIAVHSVLATSAAIAASAAQLDTKKITTIVDDVCNESEAVLRGVSFNGKQPKSVTQLIAMGARRNDDAKTENGTDEKAAFHNDAAYFKVLLEAREKHRTAMKEKLNALRTMRMKQRRAYRKKGNAPCAAAATVAAMGPPSRGKTISLLPHHLSWEGRMSKTVCPSPVSTDLDSEVSSYSGEMNFSDDKMNQFNS